MSLVFNIYKKQRNILLLVKKKLLTLNYEVSLSSEEAKKIASSSHTHTHRLLSLTPGAGTMKTQAQQVWNITCRTLLLTISTSSASKKIIMLVFIT